MVAQIVAVTIFLLMFILIVTDKIPRQWVTLGAGALMLVIVFGVCMQDMNAVIKTLNVTNIFTSNFWYQTVSSESSAGINWETIIFIAGMMVMVEGMAAVGFFRWLCLNIAKLVKYRTVPILITFMLMSAVLAMFIDSITVILFLAAVTVELAHLLKFDPVPMIISEVFCANLGGSATMCGDPPNIIIGTSLGLSFSDFITNTGVIALIALVFVVFYFYFCFRKQLKASDNADLSSATYPDPKEAITDKRGFIFSTLIFLLAVVLLVTHAQTHLTVAMIGAGIAVLTLIASGKRALSLLKKIDYHTLLFFIGLFIVVGGLEQTGVLSIIADFISNISQGNNFIMIAIILWVSAFASAFVDNIPFAATMLPVIQSLAQMSGMPVSTLAWTLSLGADIGGSATPIGASANVVGISVAAKEGHPIRWGKYCKYSVPATVIVIAVCMGCIFMRYLIWA